MFLVSLVSPRFFILLFKKLIIWISYIMHPDCPQFPVLLCIPLTPAPTPPKTNFSCTHYDLVKLLAVRPPREGQSFFPCTQKPLTVKSHVAICEGQNQISWVSIPCLHGTVTVQQRSSNINTYSGSSPDHRHQHCPWPSQDHWLTHGSQWLQVSQPQHDLRWLAIHVTHIQMAH